MSTEQITGTTNTTESPQSRKYFTDWSHDSSKKHKRNDEIVKIHGNNISRPDTNNATCIRHDMINSKEGLDLQYWRKLSLYNSGISNLEWVNESYITYSLNSHMVKALLCQLDINESHRGKIQSFVMRINFGKVGSKIEKAMFCAIASYVHMDESIGRKYHPQQKREDQDTLFAKLKEEVRLSDKEIDSLYAKLSPQNVDKYQSPTDGSRKFEKFERDEFKIDTNPQ